jgi:hypothetical protein
MFIHENNQPQAASKDAGHREDPMQDIPDLLDSLKRSGPILAGFVESIPEEKRHRRRGEGFWTVAEHVVHLAQVQPMLMERLRRFANEDRPVFTPYIPEDGGVEDPSPQMTVGEAVSAFVHVRAEQLELLEKMDADAWQKTAVHPEYAHYSLYILARHILMHDYWHMFRMEELWLTRDAYLTKSG